jgi:hypothetical protein
VSSDAPARRLSRPSPHRRRNRLAAHRRSLRRARRDGRDLSGAGSRPQWELYSRHDRCLKRPRGSLEPATHAASACFSQSALKADRPAAVAYDPHGVLLDLVTVWLAAAAFTFYEQCLDGKVVMMLTTGVIHGGPDVSGSARSPATRCIMQATGLLRIYPKQRSGGLRTHLPGLG